MQSLAQRQSFRSEELCLACSPLDGWLQKNSNTTEVSSVVLNRQQDYRVTGLVLYESIMHLLANITETGG